MSPYFILSFASPALEQRVHRLSASRLASVIAEIRRLRPLVRDQAVSAKTMMRLAARPLSQATRLALGALADYARAHLGAALKRQALIESFPWLAGVVRRRHADRSQNAWRVLWTRSHKGWRAIVWECDRRRADITIGQAQRAGQRLAQTLAALGASRVVIEHDSRVTPAVRRRCHAAGVAVVRTVRLKPVIVELALRGHLT